MRLRVQSVKPRSLVSLLMSRSRTLVSWTALGFIVAAARGEPGQIPKGETPPLSNWLSADGITGDWGGLRSKLAGSGVEFLGTEQAEAWGNTRGGLEQGIVYTGLLNFGLNLDLEKAVGWRGASVTTTWLWLSGPDASKAL